LLELDGFVLCAKVGMRKLQVRGFPCQIYFSATQCVVFDGAAYWVVATGVTATRAHLCLQGGACTHLPGNQPGVVPAVKGAAGRISPYIRARRVASRARGHFPGAEAFIGSKNRTLGVSFKLLFDARIARVGPRKSVQQSDTRCKIVFARWPHQRDYFGVGIENNKSRRLDVKNRRRAVGDRDHVDLAPLVRRAGVDQRLQKI
jgi:hypothetical protein